MNTTDDITGNWKPGIYRNYSTLFKTKVDQKAYTQFIPYAKYIIANFLPKDKNASIIDLGCGIGGFTKEIAQSGYSNIEGVDISEESVSKAHSYGLDQIKLGDIFVYLEGRSESSTDVVLCIDVIEHFQREESIRLLTNIIRVLKPGGRVLIHVPNAEGIFGAKIRYADFTHEMAYTQKSISQLLQFIGFENASSFEDKPLVHSLVSAMRRFLWVILTLPFRVLHAVETGSFSVKLSQNILVIAFKPQ